MAITALKDSARGILAVSLVPASVAGGVWAALWAIDSDLAPEMVVFPISLRRPGFRRIQAVAKLRPNR